MRDWRRDLRSKGSGFGSEDWVKVEVVVELDTGVGCL